MLLEEEKREQQPCCDNQLCGMVAGLAKGVQMYREAHNAQKPWVLFLCEDDERNVCDQKLLELRL